MEKTFIFENHDDHDDRPRRERRDRQINDEIRHAFRTEFRKAKKEFAKHRERPQKRDRMPRGYHMQKPVTKLFDNKADMIAYVNELGEKGAHIDVFKIEDGLYKVVVFTAPSVEVEIEE